MLEVLHWWLQKAAAGQVYEASSETEGICQKGKLQQAHKITSVKCDRVQQRKCNFPPLCKTSFERDAFTITLYMLIFTASASTVSRGLNCTFIFCVYLTGQW